MAATTAPGLRRQLAEAPAAERPEILLDQLERLAAAALGVGGGRSLDRQTPLQDLGLDSLMAIELRNALGRETGEVLPATLLFDHPTLVALGRYLAPRFQAAPEPAAPQPTAPRGTHSPTDPTAGPAAAAAPAGPESAGTAGAADAPLAAQWPEAEPPLDAAALAEMSEEQAIHLLEQRLEAFKAGGAP